MGVPPPACPGAASFLGQCRSNWGSESRLPPCLPASLPLLLPGSPRLLFQCLDMREEDLTWQPKQMFSQRSSKKLAAGLAGRGHCSASLTLLPALPRPFGAPLGGQPRAWESGAQPCRFKRAARSRLWKPLAPRWAELRGAASWCQGFSGAFLEQQFVFLLQPGNRAW